MSRVRFLLYVSAALLMVLILLGAFSPRWLHSRLRLLRILGIAYVAAIAALTVYDLIRRLLT